jgi:hypothetical protein
MPGAPLLAPFARGGRVNRHIQILHFLLASRNVGCPRFASVLDANLGQPAPMRLPGYRPKNRRNPGHRPEQWLRSSFRYCKYGELRRVRTNDCDVMRMTLTKPRSVSGLIHPPLAKERTERGTPARYLCWTKRSISVWEMAIFLGRDLAHRKQAVAPYPVGSAQAVSVSCFPAR